MHCWTQRKDKKLWNVFEKLKGVCSILQKQNQKYNWEQQEEKQRYNGFWKPIEEGKDEKQKADEGRLEKKISRVIFIPFIYIK